jgi:DNA polymerase
VVQATARDIMADAMLRLDEMGFDILATVHDEIIIEHTTESADSQLKVVEHVMRQNMPWSVGCPLDVEGFVTKRYKK